MKSLQRSEKKHILALDPFRFRNSSQKIDEKRMASGSFSFQRGICWFSRYIRVDEMVVLSNMSSAQDRPEKKSGYGPSKYQIWGHSVLPGLFHALSGFPTSRNKIGKVWKEESGSKTCRKEQFGRIYTRHSAKHRDHGSTHTVSVESSSWSPKRPALLSQPRRGSKQKEIPTEPAASRSIPR